MNSNQNPYLGLDVLHAEALADQNIAENFAEEFPEWEQAVDPERFVSEDDYNAATPQEWADLQWVQDWEALDF